MLVLAEDSSIKTSRPAGSSFCPSCQSLLFSARSARSRSLARSVFFKAVAQSSQRVVDGDDRAGGPELLAYLLQGGVGMGLDVAFQPVDLLGGQAAGLAHLAFARGDAATSPALALELVHPPLSHFKTLGDLAHRPLVLVVSLQNPLPQIQGISSHGPRAYPIPPSMCKIF